jgi:hypothetical protein
MIIYLRAPKIIKLNRKRILYFICSQIFFYYGHLQINMQLYNTLDHVYVKRFGGSQVSVLLQYENFKLCFYLFAHVASC